MLLFMWNIKKKKNPSHKTFWFQQKYYNISIFICKQFWKTLILFEKLHCHAVCQSGFVLVSVNLLLNVTTKKTQIISSELKQTKPFPREFIQVFYASFG